MNNSTKNTTTLIEFVEDFERMLYTQIIEGEPAELPNLSEFFEAYELDQDETNDVANALFYNDRLLIDYLICEHPFSLVDVAKSYDNKEKFNLICETLGLNHLATREDAIEALQNLTLY